MAKIYNPEKDTHQGFGGYGNCSAVPCELYGCWVQVESKKLLHLDKVEQDCFHEGSYSRRTWISTVINLLSE